MIELWTDCWIVPEEVESVEVSQSGREPVVNVTMRSGAKHCKTTTPVDSARRVAKEIRESIKAATL